MVGGLGALGVLGSIGGGFVQGSEAEARRKLLQQQAEAATRQQQGEGDAGSALQQAYGGKSIVPGATPAGGSGLLGMLRGAMSGGQPQQPGQPMQMPSAPQPQQGGQPPPQMGGQQPQGQPSQQGQGQIPPQLQQAAQIIPYDKLFTTLAQQPGMTGPRMYQALQALYPFMSAQNQQLHQAYMEKFQTQLLGIRQQDANTREAGLGIRQQLGEEGLGIRQQDANTREAGLGVRQQQVNQQGENIESQIKTREARTTIEQSKLAESTKRAGESADRMRMSISQKDLAGAQRNFTNLLAARTNAILYGKASADDPEVKAIDAQIQEAQTALQQMQSATKERTDWEGKDKGRAPPEVAAPTSAPAGGAPKPGDVDGGYKFKGGNPGDPANWEAVK